MSRQRRNDPAPQPIPADLVRLVSAEQLAEAWSIPVSSVRRFARENKIPAIKVGNLWRFKLEDLNAWVCR